MQKRTRYLPPSESLIEDSVGTAYNFHLLSRSTRLCEINNFQFKNWNTFFEVLSLGNVRVTFADEGGRLVEKSITDYDPTGVEHQNSNVSVGGFKLDLFKFQDKESLSNTFGLGGLHDFGPRLLDKTIGGYGPSPIFWLTTQHK